MVQRLGVAAVHLRARRRCPRAFSRRLYGADREGLSSPLRRQGTAAVSAAVHRGGAIARCRRHALGTASAPHYHRSNQDHRSNQERFIAATTTREELHMRRSMLAVAVIMATGVIATPASAQTSTASSGPAFSWR